MKIGVISDTHGCIETWRIVYERYFYDVDFIIHAGDVLYHGPRNDILAEYNPKALAEELNNCPVPVTIASGNCDAEVDSMVLSMPVQAPYAYVVVEGKRIIVNHGHMLTEDMVWKTASRMKAAVIITGHTHRATLTKQEGIIWLNPGSPSMSKREDKRGTIALIVDNRIEIYDWQTGEVLAREEIST
ncbi:MAG: phosphodiesterase, family [Firmicutes bacterium]|nr:phosphodiesterase, family [Bacillota bacterium]